MTCTIFDTLYTFLLATEAVLIIHVVTLWFDQTLYEIFVYFIQ